VLDAFNSLNESQRVALALHYIGGLTSRILGIRLQDEWNERWMTAMLHFQGACPIIASGGCMLPVRPEYRA
jgi:hypothetical protein